MRAGAAPRALLAGPSGGYGGAPDVVDDVLHRLQVLELVVGDFHAELVLRGHRDLDHREAVDVEVVDERLLRGDLVCRDASDLVDDLAEPGEDFLLGHSHSSSLLLLGFSYLGGERAAAAWPAGALPAAPCDAGQGSVITCAA